MPPAPPDETRRVNRALHEARRPLQRLALLPEPPAEVARIAAALEEIDAAVNGIAPPPTMAPGELRRMRLVAAIENLVVNALEHGAGTIEITASHGDDQIVVVRNRTRPKTGSARGTDPRHGHGLEVIAQAAGQGGGSFEFAADDQRAVATLALGSGPDLRAAP